MKLSVSHETWPIAGHFTIAKETRTHADVIIVEIENGGFVGRGEAIPSSYYNETPHGLMQQIQDLNTNSLTLNSLQERMPHGAARNAVDCALWDLAAKEQNTSVAELAGLKSLTPLLTAFTLSIDTPDIMRSKAIAASDKPLLKMKCGGKNDVPALRAVRESRPDARIIVDANEGWSYDQLQDLTPILMDIGVELVEQPLPARDDAILEHYDGPLLLCADESAHTSRDLKVVSQRYKAVNIKLDKTGGLTEALAMKKEARRMGLKIMVGCMVGTSLGMAPAVHIAQDADFVDLDGPLLLEKDREHGLKYDGAILYPPSSLTWG